MGPEAIRKRMAEISARLEEINNHEGGPSDEMMTEIDTLSEEYDGLDKKLVAAEKIEKIKARTARSTGRQVDPETASPVAVSRIEVGRDSKDRFGGFNSTGDFLNAVKEAGLGNVDKRFKNTMYEKNGEDGGFMIPEEMSTEIQKKLDGSESLLPRTRQFKVSGNSLSLPIDEQQPWNQGVQAYWTAEGAQIRESQNTLTEARWRLHKLAALVKATDELLEDSTALASYIQQAAPAAIVQKVNEAIISGSGAGKPKGLLNSGFAINVAAEGAQAADTVVAANIVNMYSRMIPQSRQNAVWIYNAQVEPQLIGLKNADGNYLMIGAGIGLNQGPYATLLGRPMIPMMSALPALGDSGDIMFVDFNYYYTILKAGQDQIKQAQSIHLYFDREITAFRFSMRIDGSCPFKTPVSTQYGSYSMSGIVTLADR